MRVERWLELAVRPAEYPGGGGAEHAHHAHQRVQLRRRGLRPRYVALLSVHEVQHLELNTLHPACKVHGCKVIQDIRSTIGGTNGHPNSNCDRV